MVFSTLVVGMIATIVKADSIEIPISDPLYNANLKDPFKSMSPLLCHSPFPSADVLPSLSNFPRVSMTSSLFIHSEVAESSNPSFPTVTSPKARVVPSESSTMLAAIPIPSESASPLDSPSMSVTPTSSIVNGNPSPSAWPSESTSMALSPTMLPVPTKTPKPSKSIVPLSSTSTLFSPSSIGEDFKPSPGTNPLDEIDEEPKSSPSTSVYIAATVTATPFSSESALPSPLATSSPLGSQAPPQNPEEVSDPTEFAIVPGAGTTNNQEQSSTKLPRPSATPSGSRVEGLASNTELPSDEDIESAPSDSPEVYYPPIPSQRAVEPSFVLLPSPTTEASETDTPEPSLNADVTDPTSLLTAFPVPVSSIFPSIEPVNSAVSVAFLPPSPTFKFPPSLSPVTNTLQIEQEGTTEPTAISVPSSSSVTTPTAFPSRTHEPDIPPSTPVITSFNAEPSDESEIESKTVLAPSANSLLFHSIFPLPSMSPEAFSVTPSPVMVPAIDDEFGDIGEPQVPNIPIPTASTLFPQNGNIADPSALSTILPSPTLGAAMNEGFPDISEPATTSIPLPSASLTDGFNSDEDAMKTLSPSLDILPSQLMESPAHDAMFGTPEASVQAISVPTSSALLLDDGM